jgi:hypothetical protein
MKRFWLVVTVLLSTCALWPEPTMPTRSTNARDYLVRAGATRRGRPRKFSRPARAITLTLPEDTIATLKGIDRDLGRAIVRVVQPLEKDPPRLSAELATFGNRAVILVTPSRALTERTGAHLVPLADGRALIAFDDRMSVPQFELRLLDALADPTLAPDERKTFSAVAEILRTTRRSDRAEVRQHNIIVLHDVEESAEPTSKSA